MIPSTTLWWSVVSILVDCDETVSIELNFDSQEKRKQQKASKAAQPPTHIYIHQ